jgi:shikimate dehydrogenase
MLKAGVIGCPTNHSLSPKLHQYWLQKYQIDGEYLPYHVEPDELRAFLTSLPDKAIQGVNITVPHKEATLDIMDEVDEIAQTIGAVNTVIVKEGKLFGTNTDAYGFITNLNQQSWQRNKAMVLGAGGAAKAVCYALFEAGVDEIYLTNRTLEKAEKIADSYDNVKPIAWDKKETYLEKMDVLVNTTTLGMKGELSIDIASISADVLVTDIVYTPLYTPLLKTAKEQGNSIVTGIGMLLHQAVPGFEAWFEKQPDVTPELETYMLDLCSS